MNSSQNIWSNKRLASTRQWAFAKFCEKFLDPNSNVCWYADRNDAAIRLRSALSEDISC